jgi:hypothetical protein
MLRRIFRRNGDEITASRREVHNDVRDLELCGRHREKVNVRRILMRKPKKWIPLGGRTVLMGAWKKCDGVKRNSFIWLRIGTGVGLL